MTISTVRQDGSFHRADSATRGIGPNISNSNQSYNLKQDTLKSLGELQQITEQLVRSYGALTPSDRLEKAIDSLEQFNDEVRKLEQFHYCHYESAYIYYKSCCILLEYNQDYSINDYDDSARKLGESLTEKVLKCSHYFDQIKDIIKQHSSATSYMTPHLNHQSSTNSTNVNDTLLLRLQSLKPAFDESFTHTTSLPSESNYSTKPHTNAGSSQLPYPDSKLSSFHRIPRSRSQSPSVVSSTEYQNGTSNLSKVKDFTNLIHKNFIEAEELNTLLNNHRTEVLLIDLRPRIEFDSSHINFGNIINIEPAFIKQEFETDKGFEKDLSSILSKDEFEMFKHRAKYELIVIYDQDSEVRPKEEVRKLINLLVFINVAFESKLKRYPLCLSGGINSWYKIYGPSSIKKSHFQLSFPTPTRAASISKRNSFSSPLSNTSFSEMPTHPSPVSYAKNLNDFLSTNISPNSSSSKMVSKPSPTLQSRPSSVNYDTHIQQASQISHRTYSPIHSITLAGNIGKKVDMNVLINEFSTGIQNLGNTCYMNCVIQCLAGTQKLVSVFLDGSYRQNINLNNKLGTKGLISNQFHELLRMLVSNNGKYIVPQTFKRVIGSLNNDFSGNYQQDCIEFLNYLLDSLHEDSNKLQDGMSFKHFQLTEEEEREREKLPMRVASAIEWERYLKLNISTIVDYFQGQYSSQLKCLKCSTTSTTYNSFSILSLPIPDSNSNIDSVTLYDCLDKFCASEILDGDDRWLCSCCKTKQKSTKVLKIMRLPSFLIIHFKRFKSDNFLRKLNTNIKYPVTETLDLTKYWPAFSGKEDLKKLSNMPVRNQVPPFNYKLYGVINHFGNLRSGHYTSYVYKGEKKKWCLFDDTNVTKNCDPKRVSNASAYCLFYKRV